MENCIEKLLDEIHSENMTNPDIAEEIERIQDYDDLIVSVYDRLYGEGYNELYN